MDYRPFAHVAGITAAIMAILAFCGVKPAAAPARPEESVVKPAPKEDGNKRRRLLPLHSQSDWIIGERVGPSGQVPVVDYPEKEWFKNIGSKLDGAGMCVSTAFEFAARWQNLSEFKGFRDWAAQHFKGGAWPEKLDEILEAYCKAKKIPKPHVLQYTGKNVAFLKTALDNGWLPGCTLFRCPKYGPGTIYHMTNLASFGDQCAILDNNFPEYYWFDRQNLQSRIMNPDPNTHQDAYWGFVILTAPPPPVPEN